VHASDVHAETSIEQVTPPDGIEVVVVVVVAPPSVVLVVVPPPRVVVVPANVVVVPPPTVVVVVPHGHDRAGDCPTAAARQISASVAAIGRLPLGAQMHSGLHDASPTDACRMWRQSVAVGPAPFVTGWLQSPKAARPKAGANADPTERSQAAAMMRETMRAVRESCTMTPLRRRVVMSILPGLADISLALGRNPRAVAG